MKARSYFFNQSIQSLIQKNQESNTSASAMAADFLYETEFWKNMDYNQLTSLIFSPDLPRSWFVLSNGSCPVCNKSIPMYNWQHDAKNDPWKMKCPNCSTRFPSNDFESYYKSGLDVTGRFLRENADSSLLIPEDGGFVVDDGNGWFDSNGNRYMFIGAYLCHAHWDVLIMGGIIKLAFSYVLTGDEEYALKAAVLLHAVSVFWPEFDFYTQGLMYEQANKSQGYVNYWVNSSRDVRNFALVYDQIFDCILKSEYLPQISGISNETFCNDIEKRIFRDSLAHVSKIHSNPPESELTIAIVRTVLDYDSEEIAIKSYIDDLIDKSVLIDGLSGESGLGGYAAIAPRAIADMLCLYSNIDMNLIEYFINRHPDLYKTYRFHIDSWYDKKYYPGVGDSSVLGATQTTYTALFSAYNPRSSLYLRSRQWYAMKLNELFNEPDFAKTIYHSNNNSVSNAFDHDFYIKNPNEYEKLLEKILNENGYDYNQNSINYNKWHISLLHTGKDDNKTMLAMPYDSGKNHCHHDALSLHIFAKGMNMTADFGYPAVNRGGWHSKEALWNKQPAAHNTVVIDQKLHTNMPPDGDGMFYRYPEYGQNILFTDCSFVHATYNEAKEYVNAQRFERFSALIDISDSDSYCFDVFRVNGGNYHARFQRSTFAELHTIGLTTEPGEEYDPEKTIMRNFKTDDSPSVGWVADFKIIDKRNVLKNPKNLHLRYLPLTENTKVTVCESWVDITRMTMIDKNNLGNMETWIPTIYEETTGGATQFTGILEPYESAPFILKASKLSLINKSDFIEAVRIQLYGGSTDIILLNDPNNPEVIKLMHMNIETDALFSVIRVKDSVIIEAVITKGTYLKYLGNKIFVNDSENIIFTD